MTRRVLLWLDEIFDECYCPNVKVSKWFYVEALIFSSLHFLMKKPELKLLTVNGHVVCEFSDDYLVKAEIQNVCSYSGI